MAKKEKPPGSVSRVGVKPVTLDPGAELWDPFNRARRKDGKLRKSTFPGWSPELKTLILELFADGATVREVTEFQGFPSKAELFRELANDPVFAKDYGDAKTMGAGSVLDEGLDVARAAVEADGGENVNKATVAQRYAAVATLYAEKVAPRKYGQLVKVGADEDSGPIAIHVISYARPKGGAGDVGE